MKTKHFVFEVLAFILSEGFFTAVTPQMVAPGQIANTNASPIRATNIPQASQDKDAIAGVHKTDFGWPVTGLVHPLLPDLKK